MSRKTGAGVSVTYLGRNSLIRKVLDPYGPFTVMSTSFRMALSKVVTVSAKDSVIGGGNMDPYTCSLNRLKSSVLRRSFQMSVVVTGIPSLSVSGSGRSLPSMRITPLELGDAAVAFDRPPAPGGIERA